MVGGPDFSTENPAWGTHGPDFFGEGGRSSPGSCHGFPSGRVGWGWSRVWALGPRAGAPLPRPAGLPLPWAPPSVAPPVPAGGGSCCRLACSPVTHSAPAPCPWSSGAMPCPCPLGSCPPSAPSGVGRGVSSSRKPPGLGPPLPSLSRCQSLIPWKEWRVWPRTPRPASVLADGQTGSVGVGATLPGPWAEWRGWGLVFTGAVASGCLNREGPLPGGVWGPLTWKTGVGGPRGHRECPGSGPWAASPCLSGAATPLGCLRADIGAA